MRRKRSGKGFTLIELLVVISIIAILTAIAISTFQGASKNARNAKLKAGLDTFSKLYETKYRLAEGKYPSVDTVTASDFISGEIQKPDIALDSDNKSFLACVRLEGANPSVTSCSLTSPPNDCYCRASLFGTPPSSVTITAPQPTATPTATDPTNAPAPTIPKNPTVTPINTPTAALTPTLTPTSVQTFVPLITQKPSCIDNGYNSSGITISWVNPATPVTYIDISTDSTFPDSNFYNKHLTSVVSNTTAPNGFGKAYSGLPALSLNPATTYYTRLFNAVDGNNGHSSVASFNIPACTTTPTPSISSSPSSGGGGSGEADSLAGLYVYYDWSNIDPATYPWIKGGDIDKRWNEVETSEGHPNWTDLNQKIDEQVAKGKKVMLKITATDDANNGVPQYVFDAGAPKAAIGTITYPVWWNSIFKDKLKRFITNFGNQYKNDLRVGGILISAGDYGEAMPGYGSVGSSGWESAWSSYGLTRDIWVAYVNEIVDAYVTAFTLGNGQIGKPLFVQEQSWPSGSVTQTLAIADHAASKKVNMGFNGLQEDNAYNKRWFTPFDNYVKPGTLKGRIEAHSPTLTVPQTYWAILNGLRNHATILTFYGKGSNGPRVIDNTDNRPSFEFANKYLGRTISNTPGVWIAFMKSAQAGGVNDSWAGELYNYSYWMNQINTDTTSTALYNIGTEKEGLFARKTTNTFYLGIDDSYIYPTSNARFNTTSSGIPVKITVKYLNSAGSIDIRYDSASGEKSAGTITKGTDNTWQARSFTVSDAKFGNRLTNTSDLKVIASGGDLTLHMVEVEYNGGTVQGITSLLNSSSSSQLLNSISNLGGYFNTVREFFNKLITGFQ